MKNVILLWFTEGKQSTEKPGGAHCGESRMMRFERECQRATSGSTPPTREQIRQSLIDANRAWQMHYQYLQKRLGIDLDSEFSAVTPDSTHAPVQQKAKKKSHLN